MGTWGTGIFDNDDAMDVQDVWRTEIEAGMSPQDATRVVIARLADFWADEDSAADFWLSLAALQLDAKALDADVARKARELAPQEADRWRELGAAESDCAERARVVDELIHRL